MGQTAERLPAMRETQVQSLGWEDPLEKEMATHSSPLAWKIPWTEKPGRLQSMRSQSWTRLSGFIFTDIGVKCHDSYTLVLNYLSVYLPSCLLCTNVIVGSIW